MEIIREVHCKVLKGLGPEMTEKTVSVYIDDVEADTPQFLIDEMIRNEVRCQLREAGIIEYTIEDIETH